MKRFLIAAVLGLALASPALAQEGGQAVQPPAEAADPAGSGKHRLLIQAVEETWIKIIIDDKSPEQYTLNLLLQFLF